MTNKSPSSNSPATEKLISRIAAAQKQADAAKRTAKLAKIDLRTAKQKFKDAKHAAKKLRKAIKALKVELTDFREKQPARKAGPSKSKAKRSRPARVVPAETVAEVAPGSAESVQTAVSAQ